MSIARRLRGVLGTGLTWATGWLLAGGAVRTLLTALGSFGFLAPTLGAELMLHALMGFVGGGTFAIGLLLTERPHGVLGLSLRRSAAWGALAGLVGPLAVFLAGHYSLPFFPSIPSVWPLTLWPLFLSTAVFGALSGGGMAALARGATQHTLANFSRPPDPEMSVSEGAQHSSQRPLTSQSGR